ncbi:MAG: hypothetical protein ABI841_02150 [Chloroflexota bacterium]
MARRPGERELHLSPGARRIAGWVAAVALVGGIALGVRIVGGSGDGSPGAEGSPSAPAGDVAPITFGTALDPATGLVATPARTPRFEASDPFVYSVADVPPPSTVYVEVERMGGGPAEIVQEQSVQTLAPTSPAIAFSVPAAVLLEAFGPGEYRMRIYLAGDTAPLAEGTFVLVGSVPASSAPS